MKCGSLVVSAGLLVASAAGALGQEPQQNPTLDVTMENRTALADLQAGAARADSTSRPGDVLRYHLLFTNHLDRRIREVVLHNPIPEGTRFIAGSTLVDREDVRLEFSADRGLTFSESPEEDVLVEGRTEGRPVSPERYTDVRWTVTGWVEPGGTVSARFEVRVRPLGTPDQGVPK